MVLVEASDLVRAGAFGLLATPEQTAAALRAVRRTGALVGMLLADVDLRATCGGREPDPEAARY